MQAYAKSSMPYLGVTAVPLRKVCREVFADLEFPTAAAWRRAVLGLWRGARFREERYCAIELAGVRRFDRFQDMAALPMYEEIIVTGAWWDYVDGIAGHRLGTLLRRFPREMRKEMLAWSRSDDIWKRRSAILCQLTFKKRHRSRAALRRDRARALVEGVLPPEGHRLGAPAVRLDGPEGGPSVRPGAREAAQPPLEARGAQEHRPPEAGLAASIPGSNGTILVGPKF